jgi:uncharacterized protein YbjQ (UPF0145 family)
MILATTEAVAKREIGETLGLVTGSTVRARQVGRDILAGLKNIVGGEIGAYQTLLSEAREEALARLSERAEAMGADAVIAVRMTTSSVAQGASEIVAYGTAVRLV